MKIIAIHLVSNAIMDNANVQKDSNIIQIQRNVIINVILLVLVVILDHVYVLKDKPIILKLRNAIITVIVHVLYA